MLRISKEEKLELERVGLLRNKTVGLNRTDPNYVVVNRQRSCKKHYYVAEDKDTLLFLQKFDMVPSVKEISKSEFDLLISEGLLYPNKVQHPGQNVYKSVAYVSNDGKYFIETMMSKFMIRLGYAEYKPRTVSETHSSTDATIA